MTTYYVSAATGSDSNDGLSEGNAWATIDKAMNTVGSGGDIVYVKGDADYTETANCDTAGGSAHNATTKFFGYTTTPGDDGMATINGQSTRANGLTTSLFLHYYNFANFRFTGHTGDGVSLGSGILAQFINCRFDNNGGDGFSGTRNFTFVNCQFDNNTDSGYDGDRIDWFFGCEFFGNGKNAIDSSAFTPTQCIYKCLFYEGTNTFNYVQTQGLDCVLRCTFDGENLADIEGVTPDSGEGVTCYDNIFYDLVYGARHDTGGTYSYVAFADVNNLWNSNTNDGVYDQSIEVQHEATNVSRQTGAPGFTDEASNDYTIPDTSGAADNGVVPGLRT